MIDAITVAASESHRQLALCHCEHPSTTGTSLAPLEVSRSTLERRFRELFGRSSKAELDRVRLEPAKELQLDTGLTLPAITQQTGFQHVETLHRHFRHWAGQSPAAFRRTRRPR